VRELVLPAIGHHGAIATSIVDDTGFPTKRRYSVAVTWHY
jgi:SRSO17 transposase